MAFLQNWRARRVQQTKWAGWAFLTVSRLNHSPHGKLQGFLLSPPLNQASPAFSLLLTLVPAALWACLWLSSLSIPVPCCTHRHTHTQSPQSTLLLSTCRAESLPWGLAIPSVPPSCPCSDCLQVKLQNRGTELTHTLTSLLHIFPPASLFNSSSTSLAKFSLCRFLAWAHGCSIWAPFSHAWSDVTHVRLGWFVLSPHSLPRRRAVPAVPESLFCSGKVSVCEIFLWPRGWGRHPQSSFFHPFNVPCYVEDFHNFYVISALHSSDTKNIWHCHI